MIQHVKRRRLPRAQNTAIPIRSSLALIMPPSAPSVPPRTKIQIASSALAHERRDICTQGLECSGRWGWVCNILVYEQTRAHSLSQHWDIVTHNHASNCSFQGNKVNNHQKEVVM